MTAFTKIVLRTDISQKTEIDKRIKSNVVKAWEVVSVFLKWYVRTIKPNIDNSPISCINKKGSVIKKYIGKGPGELPMCDFA